MASYIAGNTGVWNEILSIADELKNHKKSLTTMNIKT